VGRPRVRVAIVTNTSWYAYNFRRNLARTLQIAGHEVTFVSPADEFADKLVAEGFRHRPIYLKARGLNPFQEIRTVLALRLQLASIGADVVLSYTPKGNIYSGIASIGLRSRLIPNISGQGSSAAKSLVGTAVRLLYRASLRRAEHVFFQNEDDRDAFLRHGLVTADRSDRVPGSGVDLERFWPMAVDRPSKKVAFLLSARLLWSKGIGEFLEVAQRLVRTRPDVEFTILGGQVGHEGDPALLKAVEAAQAEGVIEYLGWAEDVRGHIARSDCVVLPSYYGEGVPRSLLEAAAMGKPVITTDAPGCRDVVEPGVTGFLCRVRNAADLARAVEAFLNLSPAERVEMGKRARKRMVDLFDEQIVLDRYVDVIERVS
jgi:glycosyltransferase involved in cell wall biosynthesis